MPTPIPSLLCQRGFPDLASSAITSWDPPTTTRSFVERTATSPTGNVYCQILGVTRIDRSTAVWWAVTLQEANITIDARVPNVRFTWTSFRLRPYVPLMGR